MLAGRFVSDVTNNTIMPTMMTSCEGVMPPNERARSLASGRAIPGVIATSVILKKYKRLSGLKLSGRCHSYHRPVSVFTSCKFSWEVGFVNRDRLRHRDLLRGGGDAGRPYARQTAGALAG